MDIWVSPVSNVAEEVYQLSLVIYFLKAVLFLRLKSVPASVILCNKFWMIVVLPGLDTSPFSVRDFFFIYRVDLVTSCLCHESLMCLPNNFNGILAMIDIFSEYYVMITMYMS